MSDTNANEAKLLFNLVRERYGDRLTTEELEEVRKGVDGLTEAAQTLRAQKLENGDEPFSTFVPYRKEG